MAPSVKMGEQVHFVEGSGKVRPAFVIEESSDEHGPKLALGVLGFHGFYTVHSRRYDLERGHETWHLPGDEPTGETAEAPESDDGETETD